MKAAHKRQLEEASRVQNAVVVREPNSDGQLVLKEYSFDEIRHMPVSTYYKKKDRIVNARKQVVYDTLVFDPAAPIRAGFEWFAFTRGRGTEGRYANTGVSFGDKKNWHSNLLRNGEFEGDATYLIHSMEVALFLPSILAVQNNFSQGILTNATPAAEGAQAYSATLTYEMLKEALFFEFRRTEQAQERGFLEDWTTRIGPTSSLGGDTNEGYIQNASFNENMMLIYTKVFDRGENQSLFDVRVTNSAQADLTFQSWFYLKIKLRARRVGVLWP